MPKEKISEKQFLLIINGPSCGGKSSVSKYITDNYGGIFKAKSDSIKWLISDYEPEVYRGTVTKITLSAIRTALENGLSVIKEGGLFEPEKPIEIAEENGVPAFVVNVTAPKEVLEERFQERIEAKKQGATHIANVDPKRFEELNEMYQKTKINSPLEFDSSKETPESIGEEVVSYVRKQLEENK